MKIYKQMALLFRFDPMVIHATFMFTLMMLTALVLASYVTKLVGIHIPLTFLAAITIGSQIAGVLLVYVKLGIRRTTILYIGIRVIMYFMLLLLAAGLIPETYWVYTVAGIGIIRGLIDSAYAIEYDNVIQKRFTEDFKEIQYTERTIFSLSKVIWGVVVVGLYAAVDTGYCSIHVIYIVAIILHTFSLAYQTWFYREYIRHID